MKKVKMTFSVFVDFDTMIDEKTLNEEYGGDIFKVAKFLYDEEGFWWIEPLELVEAEIDG